MPFGRSFEGIRRLPESALLTVEFASRGLNGQRAAGVEHEEGGFGFPAIDRLHDFGGRHAVLDDLLRLIGADERGHAQRDDLVLAPLGIGQLFAREGEKALQIGEQQVIGVRRLQADAMAGEEEEDEIAFLHRRQESGETLVEIRLGAQVRRQRDVLAVEAELFEIGGNVGGVRIGAGEPLDLRIAVALDAEDESASRRAGRRRRPRRRAIGGRGIVGRMGKARHGQSKASKHGSPRQTQPIFALEQWDAPRADRRST